MRDRVLKGAAGLAVLALTYELVRVSGALPDGALPPGRRVVEALATGLRDGGLASALRDTAKAWALGLLLATGLALPLGATVALSPWVDSALRVTVEFLRPVPAVALVPVAIVVFGLQLGMQVFLVATACLWPVLLGTRHGVRAVDPLLVETARSFGEGRLTVLRRVVLPAALPAVVTAVRTGASLGVVVAVAAELVSGSPGLGAYLVQVQGAGRADAAMATLLLAGLLGLAVNVALATAERRLAGWQELSTEARR